MRITVTLDDDLLAAARRFTGIARNSEIVRAALQALVEREASRRMVLHGGSDPGAGAAPRR